MLLLLMLIGLAPVSAQNAGVVFIKGDVKAGPEGRLEALKLGARVAHGQVLKTGPDGLVILAYPDESRIKVKENSEMTIQAPANSLEPSGVDLVMGAVFALVRKSSSQKFRVKTPAAVAGVRGTQFFTSYDRGTGRTWMCVKEGEVEMKKDAGEAVAVPAGLGVLVERRRPIAPPRKYKWTEDLNWNMDETAGDVVDRTRIEYDILRKNYD